MTENETPKTSVQKRTDFATKYNLTHPADHVEPKDLPHWVKMALTYHDVLGETYEESAKRFKRAGKTLQAYVESDAAKKWRAAILTVVDNPVAAAEMVLKGGALNVALEYMAAYELAKDAGDYKEQRMFLKDWLALAGIDMKPGANLQDFKPTIVINMSQGSAQIGMGDSHHAPIVQAEIIDENG